MLPKLTDMETNFEVSELMILNSGNEIVIYGTKFQDHLSFPTSCYIDNTQLNKVVNYLQSVHDNLEISTIFDKSIDENGASILFLDVKKLRFKNIPSSLLFEDLKHFAIRA